MASGNSEPASRRHRDRMVGVVLALATLAVYAPVARHEFISYDDPVYVSHNPQVQAGLTLDGVVWAFTTRHAGHWHPLTWLSHMLDCQMFGLHPGAHHLVSVLLHVANSVLLFGVLRRMTGAVWCSGFVAALFALHPLHVEAVAWASARKDVLSTLFWMLTLWAYARYAEAPRRGRYLLVLLSLAVGLMAKPMLVTLPAVLLLLDFWPLRRLGAEGPRAQIGSLVVEKVPLAALALLSAIAAFIAQSRSGAVADMQALPLGERLANVVVAYVSYIGKMIWPQGLAFFYPFQFELPAWKVAGAGLALAGASVLAVTTARRCPYLLVGWLWYVGTLVPVVGIVQVGDGAMSDRFSYVPLIGLFVALAWGMSDVVQRWPYTRAALTLAAVAVITGCGVTTWFQGQHWRNSFALSTHALEVTGDNYLAQHTLALALEERGRGGEAVAHYAEALRLNPRYWPAHNNLGVLLAADGKRAEAMMHYREALRLNPDYADAHNNLGIELAGRNALDAAIAEYATALQIDPDFAPAHYNMGVALAKQGKVDEAIVSFQTALRMQPTYAEAHFNLGAALAWQGRTSEAIAAYRAALRDRPGWPLAAEKLASILATHAED